MHTCTHRGAGACLRAIEEEVEELNTHLIIWQHKHTYIYTHTHAHTHTQNKHARTHTYAHTGELVHAYVL